MFLCVILEFTKTILVCEQVGFYDIRAKVNDTDLKTSTIVREVEGPSSVGILSDAMLEIPWTTFL